MTKDSIIFPGLNITLENVGRGVDIFGFHIAFYGVVIALGMVVATAFIYYNAKRYGENPEAFYDITFIGIVCGVIGARAYYVIFSWEDYRGHLLSIFNLREGGLAIFGGIIAGALSVFVCSKIKKIPFLRAADIVIPGVIIGQIFGRWGNFFNREAFGGYSIGLLRMGIPLDGVYSSSYISKEMLANSQTIDGVEFVFVHPTFLYESLWNTVVFILLLIIGSKSFMLAKRLGDGKVFATYLLCYGIGRFFIESLRVDQLFVPHTTVPVSMVVSAVCVVLSGVIFWKAYKNCLT